MPIHEFVPLPGSSLTQEQQREAVRAIYGIEKEIMSPAELTYEERVKMRRHLDMLDAKEAAGTKTFDLNKPPTPPYRFAEYPMLLYKQTLATTAHTYEERQQLLAAGWSEDPKGMPSAAPDPEAGLTEAEKLEAQEIDRKLIKRGKAS